MRHVFFDLGGTLEAGGEPRPGVVAALTAIAALRDDHGRRVTLGLISDFEMPAAPSEIPAIEAKYRQVLRDLGIDQFFRPFSRAVTLSTQVGVLKPDPRIFRAALAKRAPGARLEDAIFVTEHVPHVDAARALGLHALHFQGPGQSSGEVASFAALIEAIARLVDPHE